MKLTKKQRMIAENSIALIPQPIQGDGKKKKLPLYGGMLFAKQDHDHSSSDNEESSSSEVSGEE
jgi:hypothetical protein